MKIHIEVQYLPTNAFFCGDIQESSEEEVVALRELLAQPKWLRLIVDKKEKYFNEEFLHNCVLTLVYHEDKTDENNSNES